MFPEDILYTQTHEWVRFEGGVAVIGITDFAQDQMGDITYIDLPEVGAIVDAGDEIGSIESVKAASDFYSPVSGEILAVNEALEDSPELVNDDPYGDGWIARIQVSEESDDLLEASEYAALVSEEH